MFTAALQAPPRSQWEANSGSFTASQRNNCGPTCMAYIAGFYRDSRPGIEYTRRLVVGCCAPTDITAQRDMLTRLGVPAQIYNVATLGSLKSLLISGRRPVGLRIYMARVPASVRGHNFTGWHEIVAVANASGGATIMDPNLNPARYRFYPDAVLQSAFIAPKPSYAVIPIRPKVVVPSAPTITGYVMFNAGVNGVNLRTTPDSRINNIYATAYAEPRGIRRPTGEWVGHTTAKRTLYGTVIGADGHTYNRLKLAGTGIYEYVQSVFMHRI